MNNILAALAMLAVTDWTMVDFDNVEKTPIVEREAPKGTGFIGNVHGTDFVGPDYTMTSFETVNWGRK